MNQTEQSLNEYYSAERMNLANAQLLWGTFIDYLNSSGLRKYSDSSTNINLFTARLDAVSNSLKVIANGIEFEKRKKESELNNKLSN